MAATERVKSTVRRPTASIRIIKRKIGYDTEDDDIHDRGHSVQISDGYVDNMMTLYRLRRPSGRPPDDT
jgi:hypothetical protein